MEAACSIELFGTLRVRQGSRIVTRFGRRKAEALLAYLAYHSENLQTREDLATLLWPEASVEQGRDRLSTALVAIRKVLEPPGVAPGGVLVTDTLSVGLNMACVSTDVQEFDRLTQAARQDLRPAHRATLLRQAVGLYRGRLLADCYDAWALTAQRHWHERYLDTLAWLAEALEQSGDREEALEVHRRVAEAEPLREETYRARRRLLADLGRPDAAQTLTQEWERRSQAERGDAAEPSTSGPTAHPIGEARSTIPREDAYAAPRILLPASLTRFVGRTREVDALLRLLASGARLLTLTGPGGVGKTRLAVAAGRSAARQFGWNACFVPLADLPTRGALPSTEGQSSFPSALAAALGLARVPEAAALERVVAALGDTPCLLLLDNFEPLLSPPSSAHGSAQPVAGSGTDGAVTVVRDLLDRLPHLACLVTSRQSLRLQGEQLFPVTPLPLPEQDDDPVRLLACPSAALYVDRALLAAPHFALTSANAATVAALCRRLEGLPLAIEIAAAWAGTLSSDQIMTGMARRLDLLESPYVDVPHRHRTLHAAFAWSWDLLEPHLQTCLARLSVFRGGWTEEAAAEVCGQADAARWLQALQERSLVTWADAADGDTRYRLLETLRELACERLDEEQREEAQRRHGDFYLRLAETARLGLDGPNEAVWLAHLGAERANQNACLDRALEHDEAETALRLCACLQPFWWRQGHLAEGRGYTAYALDMEGGQAASRARGNVLSGAGVLARRQGDHAEAERLFGEALAVWRELGDRKNEGVVLNSLSNVARDRGEYALARRLLEEALPLAQEAGSARNVATLLGNLGVVAYYQGDYEAARAYQTQSLARERELGNQRGIAACLTNLGLICHDQGQYKQARAYYEQDLAISRALEDRESIALALNNLGDLLCASGAHAEAALCLEEALAIREEIGDRQGVASTLSNLGLLAFRQEKYVQAQECLIRCLPLVSELDIKDTAAHALEVSAELALGLQRREHAVPLYGAASRLREEIGSPLPPDSREGNERSLAHLRGGLGDAAFAAGWAQGQAYSLDQALTCALRLCE